MPPLLRADTHLTGSILVLSYSGLVTMDMEATRGPVCVSAEITLRDCVSIAELQEHHVLLPDEIHLWHVSPKIMGDLDTTYVASLLSEDERARRERFHFDKDKNNFLFCRSVLRILLASYLGHSPAELVFAYSAHGKPSLAGSSMGLKFNLSHSDGHVLIATCLEQEIGVDIERLHHDLNVRDIAQRFFSLEERKALLALTGASSYEAFFSCWTRKEAFVKALGEGLSCPLSSFDVSVDPCDEKVHLATRPDPDEASRWELWSLNAIPGFAAAVAISREMARV